MNTNRKIAKKLNANLNHDITDAKKVNELLKESEEKFSKAFHLSPVGMVIATVPEGRFVDVNNSLLHIVEYERPEVIGHNSAELNLYVNPNGRNELWQTLFEKGKFENYETIWQSKTGKLLTVICSSEKLTLNNKEHIMVTVIDITERKKSEQALLESERRFREMFENHQAMMLLIEPESGRIIDSNDAASKFYGYSREALTKMNIADINQLPVAQVANERQIALRKQGIRFIFPHRLANGEIRTVEVNSSPIKINNQQILFSIIQDVTEQERAKVEISHLASFPELNPNPVLELFTDGNVKYANPATKSRFPDLLTQGNKHPFLQESTKIIQEALMNSVTKDISVGNACFEQTLVYVPSTNTYRLYCRDITARKNIEAELRSRTEVLETFNDELQDFSYSVSHDLRTPLRGIAGFSSVLLEDYYEKLDDDGKKYLKRIQESSELLAELMDDLHHLSRMTRADINVDKVNLSELAQKVVDELKKNEPRRKVEIIINPDMTVYGDRNMLGILLENLIGNAWKYSRKTSKPKIEIGITEYSGKQAYFVRDNGVGFDLVYVNKLFKPFQRLHAETEFAGNGIGLATVQRIVRRHGGQVWAEAKVGEGATFYFTLNLQNSP